MATSERVDESESSREHSPSATADPQSVCRCIKARPEPPVGRAASGMFISHSFTIGMLETPCSFIQSGGFLPRVQGEEKRSVRT
ncbi:hypothetical protein EYF80_034204 [Liparis tanakae]|uniref:Uncharacterized protein n=1 Tax=Liparis tanakae TaxID=230148 RepID=A0A4Z2GPX6_9TELE|nr:hypothetical protein EYF80_034204 [Liparis tanakae]